MSSNRDDHVAEIEQSVGPFTGFGNFFTKEILDWWKSWRLIIIFAIPALVATLEVFFGYPEMKRHFIDREGISQERLATFIVLGQLRSPVLLIFIIIFSTMGLLTTEKHTGTLAWNLTKPLGRTGLLTAKWLAATTIIWVAMCVLPVLIASLCMIGYNGVTPMFAKMMPIVAVAFLWIGFWVLMMLTISLGFQSQGAVGGIAIACWIVPALFSLLLGEVLGKEARDWLLDRFAPNAPMWAFTLVADDELIMFGKRDSKDVWIWAFAVWSIVLSAFSLRIFNRQEIGS